MSGGTERRGKIEGTAREVREAALPPWHRDMLAGSLQVARVVGGPRSADRRLTAADRRRGAIGFMTLSHGEWSVALPDRTVLEARAAARAAGQPLDEFVSEWIAAGIEATRDEFGLKFTRQERAALERMKEGQGSSLDYSALTEGVDFERGTSRRVKCEPSTAKDCKR